MDMLENETKVRDYNLERLIMLTDGVFAIALTLLALELRPPEHWQGDWPTLVNATFRPFIAYAMSFFFIAIYWASHRRAYKRFKRADGMMTAINFLLLALITLVPFASRLIAEVGGERSITDNPVPLFAYMGVVAAIGVANALQWGWAAFIGKDILESRMGAPLRLLIFLILLIMPTMMAGMSFVAARPGNLWLYIPMILLVVAVMWTRHVVGKKHDG